MQNNRAQVTISKQGCQKGQGPVVITIEDRASGCIVVEVEMDLVEYAECITGMGSCHAEFKYRPTPERAENFGKVRETDRISIKTELSKHFNEDELKQLIDDSVPEGWEMWDDGCRSQQNTPGHHTFIVHRYVEKVDDRERY